MTAAMAAHGSSGDSIGNLLFWFWILGGGGAIGGAIAWLHDVLSDIGGWFRHLGERRRGHRLRMRRLELEIERARSGRLAVTTPQAIMTAAGSPPCIGGPLHKTVVPVRDTAEGKVVSWLCMICDNQLPAGSNVSMEDL